MLQLKINQWEQRMQVLNKAGRGGGEPEKKMSLRWRSFSISVCYDMTATKIRIMV